MAKTAAAALLKLIQTLGTGTSVYLDQAPVSGDGTPKRPYITVSGQNPMTPGPGGATLEDGGPGTVIESVHVDVWQDWKNDKMTAIVEDPSIPAKIAHGVHGAGALAADRVLADGTPGNASVIYRFRLSSAVRMLDPSVENLIHNAMVFACWRQF
jgi:hypothetical protein